MTEKQKPELELAVLIEPVELKGYDHRDESTFWKLRFVTVSTDGKVRNPSSSFGSEPYAAFDSLFIRSYLSWRTGKLDSYQSHEVLYDGDSNIGLRDAERMVKQLKRVEKIISRFIVRPETFGQYVALLSQGFGIKRYVEVEGRSSGWHNENSHRFGAIKDVAARIDWLLQEAERKKFPAAEEVA